MNRRILIPLLTAVLLVLGTGACKRNRLKVNLSGSDVHLSIKRFEKELFSVSPDSVEQKLPELEENYGLFFKRFGELIHIGEPEDPTFAGFLRMFLTDTLIRDVYTKTLEVFPDLKNLENTLRRSFRYYHYYFPEKSIPDVITYISGFNASLMIDEGFVGIGLDRYLDGSVDYYDRLAIPKYMQKKMIPEKIPSDVMYALAQTEFPFATVDQDSIIVKNNVISRMIYEGKLLYFVEAMMPRESESLIIGFTPEQIKWCKLNEAQMWAYLIEHKLLFSTDYFTINKLTKDAPFTSYFPQESPGRAANWIGWQIVREYMNANPEISLQQLMNNTDYQQILDDSGYSPEM